MTCRAATDDISPRTLPHSPDYTVGSLFDWCESGDVEVPTAVEELSFALTLQSAQYWRAWTAVLGRSDRGTQ